MKHDTKKYVVLFGICVCSTAAFKCNSFKSTGLCGTWKCYHNNFPEHRNLMWLSLKLWVREFSVAVFLAWPTYTHTYVHIVQLFYKFPFVIIPRIPPAARKRFKKRPEYLGPAFCPPCCARSKKPKRINYHKRSFCPAGEPGR